MKIANIETATIKAAWGPPENGETREWPIVLVHSEDGKTGIGRGGDAEIINKELAPLLVGEDPKRIAMLWERMYEAAWRYRGPGMAAMAAGEQSHDDGALAVLARRQHDAVLGPFHGVVIAARRGGETGVNHVARRRGGGAAGGGLILIPRT